MFLAANFPSLQPGGIYAFTTGHFCICVMWKKTLFSTLILGSVFNDYVVFYGDLYLVGNTSLWVQLWMSLHSCWSYLQLYMTSVFCYVFICMYVCLLPSSGPRTYPGVQAVSPQVTISHPPSGRLPLLSARPVVTFPAAEHHCLLAGTKLYCLVTEAHRCEQHVRGCYTALPRVGFEPTTCWSQVQCSTCCVTYVCTLYHVEKHKETNTSENHTPLAWVNIPNQIDKTELITMANLQCWLWSVSLVHQALCRGSSP